MADELERRGATVGRTARPAFDATQAFHIYLQALDAAGARGRPRRCWRRNEAARRVWQSGRHQRRRDDGSRDRHGAPRLAGVERAAHEVPPGLERFLPRMDVLLSPVISTAALPHMQEGASIMSAAAVTARTFKQAWVGRHVRQRRDVAYNDMLFWPGLTAGFHLPATVVPIGFTKAGLPLGASDHGPVYGDRMTLMAASLFDRRVTGFGPPMLD